MSFDPFAGAPPPQPAQIKLQDRLPAGTTMYGRIWSVKASPAEYQGEPRDQQFIVTIDVHTMQETPDGKPQFTPTGERGRIFLHFTLEEPLEILASEDRLHTNDILVIGNAGKNGGEYDQYRINTLPGQGRNDPNTRIALPALRKMTAEERKADKSRRTAAKQEALGKYAAPVAPTQGTGGGFGSGGGFGGGFAQPQQPASAGNAPEIIDLDKLDDNEFF